MKSLLLLVFIASDLSTAATLKVTPAKNGYCVSVIHADGTKELVTKNQITKAHARRTLRVASYGTQIGMGLVLGGVLSASLIFVPGLELLAPLVPMVTATTNAAITDGTADAFLHAIPFAGPIAGFYANIAGARLKSPLVKPISSFLIATYIPSLILTERYIRGSRLEKAMGSGFEMIEEQRRIITRRLFRESKENGYGSCAGNF